MAETGPQGRGMFREHFVEISEYQGLAFVKVADREWLESEILYSRYRDSISRFSPEILKYEEECVADRKLPVARSSLEELVETAVNSDFLFIGDHHSNGEFSRGAVEVLKAIKKKGREYMLAMELFLAENQERIDALSPLAFNVSLRKLAGFARKRRNFSWSHFSPIIREGIKSGARIYGLDCEGSLFERDRKAARVLNSLAEDWERLKVVVFGDLHLSDSHLVGKVKGRKTVLYQNLRDIYWGAKVSFGEAPHFVRLGRNKFCHLNCSQDKVAGRLAMAYDVDEGISGREVYDFLVSFYEGWKRKAPVFCFSADEKVSMPYTRKFSLVPEVLAQAVSGNGKDVAVAFPTLGWLYTSFKL